MKNLFKLFIIGLLATGSAYAEDIVVEQLIVEEMVKNTESEVFIESETITSDTATSEEIHEIVEIEPIPAPMPLPLPIEPEPLMFSVEVKGSKNDVWLNITSIEDMPYAGELEIKEAHIVMPSDLDMGDLEFILDLPDDFHAAVIGQQSAEIKLGKERGKGKGKGISKRFLSFPEGEYNLTINGQYYGVLIIDKKDAELIDAAN